MPTLRLVRSPGDAQRRRREGGAEPGRHRGACSRPRRARSRPTWSTFPAARRSLPSTRYCRRDGRADGPERHPVARSTSRCATSCWAPYESALRQTLHGLGEPVGAGAAHGAEVAMTGLRARCMDVRPSSTTSWSAFEAGRPQVVSTSLVADLETPVSAMLKLADGRPYSFLLESVDRRRCPRPLLDPGHQARPDLALPRQPAEINRRARVDARRLRALRRAGAGQPAPPHRREPRSSCRTGCRRWPPGCSATWPTTWSG